ncbi:MAG TPA: hypothetical protein VN408_39180 [Actinoplanes sp.]|nr:hypothetical protein [Actinoplanes sp.]
MGCWQRVAVLPVIPVTSALTRRTWPRMEAVPAADPVILVAHHVHRSGWWPRFLGRFSVWKVPIIGFLLLKTRQIPVGRGSVEIMLDVRDLLGEIRDGEPPALYDRPVTRAITSEETP